MKHLTRNIIFIACMTNCELLIPGHFYHVYNRGNNKENLFYENCNYHYFLDKWNNHITPIADTFAYSLLKNHFHFFIQIKHADQLFDFFNDNKKKNIPPHQILSQQFSNFFNSYAKSINKKYNRTGSLFQERFRRKLIASDDYFTELIYYIHSNPQKHGIISNFFNYPFSSFKIITSDDESFIKKESVINCFGGKEKFIDYHKIYRDSFLAERLFLENLLDDSSLKMTKRKQRSFMRSVYPNIDF